jgi:hypothetical protein
MGAATDAAAVARSMRRIEEEATRMGVLVEDLLTLARLDQVAHARQDEVELAALARDAADDARATAPDRTVTVREEEPAVVRGDADQLRQVVANLTRNALLHTPAGTPNELSVPAGRLTVRDHGPGLPADDASAIFERFWRAEGGRARQERSRARPGDRGRDRRRPRRSSPREQRAGRRRGVRRRAAQGHGPVFARPRAHDLARITGVASSSVEELARSSSVSCGAQRGVNAHVTGSRPRGSKTGLSGPGAG